MKRLLSEADITLKRWRVALPSTLTSSEVLFADGQRRDLLLNRETGLLVEARADWPLSISLWTPGDSALGRGARCPVPLHLIYESPHLRLPARQDRHWRITMKIVTSAQS